MSHVLLAGHTTVSHVLENYEVSSRRVYLDITCVYTMCLLAVAGYYMCVPLGCLRHHGPLSPVTPIHVIQSEVMKVHP